MFQNAQAVEKTIIMDTIVPRLKKLDPDGDYVTLHDGIYTNSDKFDHDTVAEMFKETAYALIRGEIPIINE